LASPTQEFLEPAANVNRGAHQDDLGELSRPTGESATDDCSKVEISLDQGAADNDQNIGFPYAFEGLLPKVTPETIGEKLRVQRRDEEPDKSFARYVVRAR